MKVPFFDVEKELAVIVYDIRSAHNTGATFRIADGIAIYEILN